MSPKQVVSPLRISDIHKIKTLMWAGGEQELVDYFKWSLHPNDCDMRVLEDKKNNRCVYMNWKSMNQSQVMNINVPASRILVENSMVDPPMIGIGESDLLRYTHIFPSDHVVFHQTVNGELHDYPKSLFLSDWKYMFPQERMPAYRRLAQDRYSHYSQALVEFEHTGKLNSLVKTIIKEYMGKQVGPCTHWDQAQLAVLGAALCKLYQRDWDCAHETPRCKPLVLR